MPADSSRPNAPRGLVKRSDNAAASAAALTETGRTVNSRQLIGLFSVHEQQLVEDDELHDPQHTEAEQSSEVDEQTVGQPAVVMAPRVMLGDDDQPRREGQSDEGQRPERKHHLPEM